MAVAFDMARESALLDAEKPYLELFDGVEVPKAAAMIRHAKLQAKMGALVLEFFGDRGDVGTEARVWLDDRTSLVPDVAFIARERYAGLSYEQRQLTRSLPTLWWRFGRHPTGLATSRAKSSCISPTARA